MFSWIANANGNEDWKFDADLFKAYECVVNLNPDKANELLARYTGNTLHKMYVQTLNETLQILITEDHAKFAGFDENFKERLKYLEGLAPSAESLFLQAEIHLQRGFCYLNLGQELNAVLSIRKANQFVYDCQKKFPAFIPLKKTAGAIQVMVGSVPEKYQWFMSLLGMRGSVMKGQSLLADLRKSPSSLSIEAGILYFAVKGFINQQFAEAAEGINDCLKDQPGNRLLLFMGVNMLVKDARSEEALQLIHRIDQQTQGLPMHYINYLRGEIQLQKGEHARSIESFKKFIDVYPSISFKKDAHFKIALNYWLMNDTRNAQLYFDKAKITGTARAEPDRYASSQLETGSLPNKKLTKVRFSTDGGYYKEANAALQTISPADLPAVKEQTEYYYRKARLAHRTGELSAAKLFYRQSIDMTKNNPWYFGANAALQLGYIAKEQKDFASARKYFELALSFPRHEYKNSIDSKARTELELLNTAKDQS
ncbi:MAG: tetratricopeptide repeat protein [Cyclobacteriaceae bacterium]|nr:tetratricopeptide repeat protein [Cyclobacteriaceae bacterium]